jgi:hypothetical protein
LTTFSAERAVQLGQLFVNLPVLIIIATVAALGFRLYGPIGGVVGLFLGPLVAWIWWSFSVPRWRQWAKEKGADEERTQTLAVKTGLVWPKGHFFEKTEFRSRTKK